MRTSIQFLNSVAIFAPTTAFLIRTSNFFTPTKHNENKPKEVRYIEKDVIDSLKNALLAERKAIVKESIALRVIGIGVACPLSCIESICAQANVISSA